ncbi:hypothetical protein FRB96_002846 [Tulasnella sp. 330]|nr:hypothetical protein FRB96_002846 [Tulasnella sp. 330]
METSVRRIGARELYAEVDRAVDRAKAAVAKSMSLEMKLLQRDGEIWSLECQLSKAEEELENVEGKLTDAKHMVKDRENGLQRKVQLLEAQLNAWKKYFQDTSERVRQVEAKAEHLEGRALRLRMECNQWEKKHEEAELKYQDTRKRLYQLVSNMRNI